MILTLEFKIRAIHHDLFNYFEDYKDHLVYDYSASAFKSAQTVERGTFEIILGQLCSMNYADRTLRG
jgi:hypothetical protein